MAATILDEIIALKREEVADAKARLPLPDVKAKASAAPAPRDFHAALRAGPAEPARIIAECKRQSPSKGVLCKDYDPVTLARSYAAGGAAAISCLTDEKYFGGHLDHLQAVRQAVDIPVLRKDFIIGEYQVYEARAAGADSFLLLSGTLGPVDLAELIALGRELGMEPLVESHTADQLEAALGAGARIVGINNRNLETFTVDLAVSKALASTILGAGADRIPVCESGIKGPEDVARMRAAGFDAFLVGETLVKSGDPTAMVQALREATGDS